jgi:hypothetical protein
MLALVRSVIRCSSGNPIILFYNIIHYLKPSWLLHYRGTLLAGAMTNVISAVVLYVVAYKKAFNIIQNFKM